MNFLITLRGVELEVEGEMSAADPSVGITSPYIEDYTVTDVSTGVEVDWDFTEEEVDQIQDKAVDTYYDDLLEDD